MFKFSTISYAFEHCFKKPPIIRMLNNIIINMLKVCQQISYYFKEVDYFIRVYSGLEIPRMASICIQIAD